MKNYIMLLLLAGQTFVAAAQDNKSLYLTKSLSGNAISNVTAKTSAGSIVVSGSTGQAPRVEVYIKATNGSILSKSEIQKRLDADYVFDIDVNGHNVKVTAKTKRQGGNFDWKKGLNISLRIYIPKQCSTDIETSGGGIGLDNLNGDQRFATSGGGLQLDRLTGNIRGNTSGGGIYISNSNNNIDLETSGGGIEAKNCSGKIKLITSGGSLQLTNLKGSIDAQSSGGGIDGININGELIASTSGGGINLKHIAGNLDASTSGGSLFAGLTQVGKYVKLGSSAGSINIELPQKHGYDLNLRGENIMLPSFNGFKGKRQEGLVQGKLNNGGTTIMAEASGGNVNVKFN